MNREAVCVGTPAISTYPEKLLSVTKFLIDLGLKKHSVAVPEIIHYAHEFMADEHYRDKALQTLHQMEDPADILLREIRKFADEDFK